MKLPINKLKVEGKMKSIILLLLFLSPKLVQANEAFISAANCLEYEYDLAKEDYKHSELAKVLEFESFLKLRCEPILQSAMNRLPQKAKAKKQAEQIDLNCPNCLRFKVMWDSSGLKKIGIQRNNIFLISKEY